MAIAKRPFGQRSVGERQLERKAARWFVQRQLKIISCHGGSHKFSALKRLPQSMKRIIRQKSTSR